MRYEWDEKKNRQNQRKHGGISFELSALVFTDDNCLLVADRVDDSGEERWHAIGIAEVAPNSAAVLLVVHVYREENDGEEIIRIISARRAENHEAQRYREQAVD